jgi:hypothetical protein
MTLSHKDSIADFIPEVALSSDLATCTSGQELHAKQTHLTQRRWSVHEIQTVTSTCQLQTCLREIVRRLHSHQRISAYLELFFKA